MTKVRKTFINIAKYHRLFKIINYKLIWTIVVIHHIYIL